MTLTSRRAAIPDEAGFHKRLITERSQRTVMPNILGNQARIKFTSISFREETRKLIFLVAFGFVLAHSAAILLVGISLPLADLPRPLLEQHSFRQTQTAWSAYWIMH